MEDKKLINWRPNLAGSQGLPVDEETSAWALSFLLHLLLLVVLAFAMFSLPSEDSLVLTVDPINLEEEPFPEEFRFSEELQDDLGALADSGWTDAAAAAPQNAMEPEIVVAMQPVSTTPLVKAIQLEQTLLQGPNVVDHLLVKGVGSVGVVGAAGAVDRISLEILKSLDHRPTLVVWLFDQSLSLQAQRDIIAARFDRIYDELGVIESAGNPAFARHKDKPLLTSVGQFATKLTLLTPDPTDDIEEIKSAVRAVTDDPNGEENVFQAVGQIAQRFRQYRRRSPHRNVMIVVFTDEAGNDVQHLDDTVARCRKLETPVYVVGAPAPFGRRQAYVKYVDPDSRFDQSPQRVAVDQGPESLMPERIKLGFLGEEDLRDESLDSGFGPFGLTRLTYETGGIYFSVHPNRRTDHRVSPDVTQVMSSYIAWFFDARVMRRYRPDYITVKEYDRLLSRNRARSALVQASRFSWTTPMERVEQIFEKTDDAQFAQTLSRAQRAAAKLEPKIARIVTTIQSGERDRPKLMKPRWQAGYDLAMGRALAAKVRTEGYNAMLAQAKQGMKFKQRSDTWIIEPDDNVTSGSVLAKDARRAKEYLDRVVAEHPGTPWALLARRELASPLGWEWREEFRNLVARQERREESARNRPPRVPKNLPPRKERRPLPKL